MRYIVPCCIVDHFGGCIEPKDKSRLYYQTGVGDRPVIVKFRQQSKRQYFALMGRRSTTPSQSEIERRQHFADVQHQVAYYYAHPHLLQDQKDAFKVQKQYTTFRSYLWHKAEEDVNATPNAGNA